MSKLAHLSARFFTSLSSTPPSDETEAWVAERLLPGEQRLWAQMSNQDRRHSALVGQRFAQLDPGTRFRAYHDHEEIGAAMAEAAGSDPATVELIAGRGPAFVTLKACDHA